MTGFVQFEVLPLPGIAREAAAHLPAATRVTVTASARQGLEATAATACELADLGLTAVPHLAARAVRSREHLDDLLSQLRSSGIHEAFVIAGDLPQPAGDFQGASDLLEAIAETGYELRLGIGAYPEGHPFVPEPEAFDLLRRRAATASYLVTQMCFSAELLTRWILRLREAGIDLPVRPGIASPVSTARLVRIAGRIGVGPSLRLLTHHRSGIRHLLGPRSWSPDDLLEDLAPDAADPGLGLGLDGLHLYTFNAVEAAARWWSRREPPAELSA